MNNYVTTLLFCGMVAAVVSAGLRMQGLQNAEFKHLLDRLGAQKKAAHKQLQAVLVKSGAAIEKKEGKRVKKGRSLPYRRVDIMPLFAKGCDGAFESLVFEIAQMPRSLFDAFLKAARRLYQEKNGMVTLWDLAALSFDSPEDRLAYFTHIKGRHSLFNRIKIESCDAQIPVHQIDDEIVMRLFDVASAQKVIAKRKKLREDIKEPLWKSSDLTALKMKDPLWRDWIKAGVDSQGDEKLIEQSIEGSACVERMADSTI